LRKRGIAELNVAGFQFLNLKFRNSAMPMAGYSGTPLVKKLGIKAGDRLALVGAPKGFEEELEGLPADVRLVGDRAEAEVAIVFAQSVADFEKRFAAATQRMTTDGMVWAAWPKKASGIQTDLDESKVRGVGLKIGVVDVKVCAINDTWSGLKFVIRVKDRAKRATAK
jgi:hypothetical protein